MRLIPLVFCLSMAGFAQEEAAGPPQGSQDPINARTFTSLRARSVGPAFISGRVNQIAVFPDSPAHYLVMVASGGLWMTRNNGTSFTPVFDSAGSYSMGYVAIDEKNPEIVWAGTGENNNQRSVSYGDGIYKSEDGGRTFRNVGLRNSEHIGKIIVDPRDSNVVWVAVSGPLWKGGGERGLYKTTDGGRTWNPVASLKVGEYTGCPDMIMDPRNPDIMLVVTHQRQRTYFGIIHGGPESALWRTADGGKTFTKVGGGFPSGDLGRIGVAYAPSNPSIVYAQVEGPEGRGGLFRSNDNGLEWERRNSSDSQGQYYSKVVVDPATPDRVYAMNVNIAVSDDGGRTQTSLGTRNKHVDNHDIWVDPKNDDHYLVGCDGGLYESWDRAATWIFKSNLPTAQLYDVAADESTPFYNVYGGTQDNNSFGCPGKTRNQVIVSADCFVTNGGDGFYTKVDPKDPNTVYANMQNAGTVRFDRRTGERVNIQPQPDKNDPALRWNWDAPMMISPHSNTRLYIGSQKLFRSDDRGDSWKAVSPDLTRALDRNKLPLMGRVWPVEAIQKNVSTALYDNISAIAESPKQEGLIYVGTDDGLIQITEDGGKTWRKEEKMAGVPDNGYVQRIFASQHDANVVYVAFENHQNGDFKPYLLMSKDKGHTWSNIAGNLPERGGVYAIAEDHVNPKLLFVGTEFGLYYTVQGGERWIRLQASLPTILVRDLWIHKGMDDLIIGTFGRGIYIIDDYTALRYAATDPAVLTKDSYIFPVKTALSYIPFNNNAGDEGETKYTAANPAVGAVITYFIKDIPTTKLAARQQAERQAVQRGETPPYPTPEQLREESQEEAPQVIITIGDAAGKPIRRIAQTASAGLQRMTWDLRAQGNALAAAVPTGVAISGTSGAAAGGAAGGRGGAGGGAGAGAGAGGGAGFAGGAGGGAAGGGRGGAGGGAAGGGRGGAGGGGRGGAGGGAGGGGAAGGGEEFAGGGGRGGGGGPFVVPGKYTVSLAKMFHDEVTPLAGSQTFEVKGEGPATNEDRAAMVDFQLKVANLQRALTATQQTATEAGTTLSSILRAIDGLVSPPLKLRQDTIKAQHDLDDINLALRGDSAWRALNEGTPASISERVSAAGSGGRGAIGRPTKTAQEQYQIAFDELSAEIPKLRKIVETDIKALEKQLDALNAPYTPGRLPELKK